MKQEEKNIFEKLQFLFYIFVAIVAILFLSFFLKGINRIGMPEELKDRIAKSEEGVLYKNPTPNATPLPKQWRYWKEEVISLEDSEWRSKKPNLPKKAKAYSKNHIASLTVHGTTIESAPVMQNHGDSSFYLSYNEYDRYDIRGAYFIPSQWQISEDQMEKITIIFGYENGEDGTEMFGQLKKFQDYEFSSVNQFITLQVGKRERIYQIFAVGELAVDPIYTVANPESAYFQEILSRMQDCSMYKYLVPVSEKDEILVLSVCSRNKEDQTRFVVCARYVI